MHIDIDRDIDIDINIDINIDTNIDIYIDIYTDIYIYIYTDIHTYRNKSHEYVHIVCTAWTRSGPQRYVLDLRTPNRS